MEGRCHRLTHHAVLLALAAGLFLPLLGAPSLWDIDEGHNTEAAREMRESGNWIVPTFNFQLRVDKPALLYWLQMAAFEWFGVNEFSARLPSVVASALAMLVVYELGRAMFGAAAGFLSGVILGSTLAFCGAGRFANPDALLNLFTLLALTFFWLGFARADSRWFLGAGLSAGLAVLAKGPVGLVLPALVIGLFLVLTRRLVLLWDRRVCWAFCVCGAVALPWYIWVSLDTKADFLRGFILTHNVHRFLSPMENHRGPFWYYLAVLLVGFAPWSAFFGLTVWSSIQEWRGTNLSPLSPPPSPPSTGERGEKQKHLFLWSWMAVYGVFFTASSTKLPNYILPLYPALALLTARCLDRWRRDELPASAWTFRVGLLSLGLIGSICLFGLLIVGGTIPLTALHGRQLAGMETWAFLGVFPIVGAALAWWLMTRRRSFALGGVAGAAVLFVGGLAAGGAWALDAHKAPRPLGDAVLAAMPHPEIRVGCFGYYQPSLVYYCRRKIDRFETAELALEFLRVPLPAYLFLPAQELATIQERAAVPVHVLGRSFDLYRGCEVVVVSNRPAQSP